MFERSREEFSAFDEFVHWYNCVRYESLNPKGLKAPLRSIFAPQKSEHSAAVSV